MSGEGVSAGGLRIEILSLTDPTTLLRLADGLVADSRTLYLFSEEWLTRRDPCKAYIRARLGSFDMRVGARDCRVVEIRREDAVSFANRHHIQGDNRLNVANFGLFSGSELVGLLSLGRHSRQIAQNRVVLDRLCFKAGVQVIGGASKLMSRAVEWAREHRYDELLTFSDNRWTDGQTYQKLGFTLEKSYGSDYFYVKDGVVYSKQSQKKTAVGCPESMTEFEWAGHRGLTRVYDAGKKRWVLNLFPESHVTWKDQNSKKCAEQHKHGSFKHAHIRGYFKSEKNKASIYFGSSYELRCLFLLEADPLVATFRRCDAFKGPDRWRNPDLWVGFVTGTEEIWEIKPEALLSAPGVQDQLRDSREFAEKQKVSFRVWSEKDSQLKGEREVIEWAKAYLAEVTGDDSHVIRHKKARQQIRARYYERHIANDTVDTWCDYCSQTHTVLRLSYDRNIKRNGTYICERHGGHIAGKRPKTHLKKTNPYAAEGRKQCSRCQAVLALNLFDVRRASWDGVSAACKACISGRVPAVKSRRHAKTPNTSDS